MFMSFASLLFGILALTEKNISTYLQLGCQEGTI